MQQLYIILYIPCFHLEQKQMKRVSGNLITNWTLSFHTFILLVIQKGILALFSQLYNNTPATRHINIWFVVAITSDRIWNKIFHLTRSKNVVFIFHHLHSIFIFRELRLLFRYNYSNVYSLDLAIRHSKRIFCLPGIQMQRNPPLSSMQVPSFWQGLDSHSLMFSSQRRPLNPVLQSHLQEPAVFTQTPSCSQGEPSKMIRFICKLFGLTTIYG